jgi:probable HAF family extracellular repeat protein
MASRLSRSVLALALLAVPSLTIAGAGPATAHPGHPGHHPTAYRVDELSSLGGTVSAGSGINNRGTVTGYSYQAGDATVHATRWRHGNLTDLGTLGGANSAVLWPVKSSRIVVGVSETASTNPYGEDWSCSVSFPGNPTHHNCVGFVWQHGHMRALPTLGGDNGYAAGDNQRGQIVGWAENGKRDPSCTGNQVEQFRAVRWDAGTHRPHELAPLGTDPTSAATAINDRGQAVGISGVCGTAVGRFSATHAVIWDRRGGPQDMGNIGGVAWNTPAAINNNGVVTGFANVPGGATSGSFYPHAFVWTAGRKMRDLGTLPSDLLSEGLGINSRGQIVGESCQAHLANCRAFLWQDGAMTDLNSLVPAGGPHLAYANDIDDAGEIAGQAVDGSRLVAFLASPVDKH